MRNRKFKMSIYVDQANTHVHMRVFVNGSLAGKLVVRRDEYIPFWGLLHAGVAHKPYHFEVVFHDEKYWESEQSNER